MAHDSFLATPETAIMSFNSDQEGVEAFMKHTREAVLDVTSPLCQVHKVCSEK